MGLGVLEDRHLNPVPGTATLEDLSGPAINAHGDNLKRNKDGLILVPQPSDDPADPLNWPLWQRDVITTILSLTAVFASTLTPLMAANNITYIAWFSPGMTVTKTAMLTGWHMLGIGIGGYFFVASARIWGKRHLYLLGTFILVVSCIWGGCSGHSYNSLVAARFFQGIGLAPFEALVNTTVGDIYFVHESGLRMALTNMSLFGASFLSPVIVGHITGAIGWQWTFWLVAIFMAAVSPLVVFFCPETTYNRTRPSVALPPSPSDVSSPSLETKGSSAVELVEKKGSTASSDVFTNLERCDTQLSRSSFTTAQEDTHWQPTTGHKFLCRQSLRVFTGRKTDESFWKLCLRPLPLFFHPAILWACLIQGTIIGWTVLLGVMLALLMLDFGFNEVKTGNMYAGAFVGALLGFVLCGLVSDSSAKWLTKRNKGVYEPEFRLVMIIPLLIFGAGGLYGFGIVASTTAYGWLLPDVFFGSICVALVFGTVGPALYLVDAHRDLTVEAFTCLLFFKNIFAWVLCYRGYFWLSATGPKGLFTAIASAEVVICCLTIPMYIFGKRMRSFMARHDYLKSLGLR